MTEKSNLVSGILGKKFKMEIIFPQISKEAPKASEVLPVSLSVVILETKIIRRKETVSIV